MFINCNLIDVMQLKWQLMFRITGVVIRLLEIALGPLKKSDPRNL